MDTPLNIAESTASIVERIRKVRWHVLRGVLALCVLLWLSVVVRGSDLWHVPLFIGLAGVTLSALVGSAALLVRDRLETAVLVLLGSGVGMALIHAVVIPEFPVWTSGWLVAAVGLAHLMLQGTARHVVTVGCFAALGIRFAFAPEMHAYAFDTLPLLVDSLLCVWTIGLLGWGGARNYAIVQEQTQRVRMQVGMVTDEVQRSLDEAQRMLGPVSGLMWLGSDDLSELHVLRDDLGWVDSDRERPQSVRALYANLQGHPESELAAKMKSVEDLPRFFQIACPGQAAHPVAGSYRAFADSEAVFGLLVPGVDDATLMARLAQMRRPGDQQRDLVALGRLVSGVAHDVNNVVFAVMASVGAALDEIEPDSEAHAYLKDVQASCRSLTAHLKTLLGFANSRRVPLEAFPLREAVKATLESAEIRTPDNVVVEWEFNERADPMVSVNLTLLAEYLREVFDNAVRAQPHGGRIVVTVVETVDSGRLEVSDDGVGMSADVVEHCFDPYYTTWGSEESGLGLSTAYGVAQSLGGRILVDSELGIGTTVSLVLPLTAEES